MLRTGLPRSLDGLSGAALALVIDKPFAWEYRLFSQVLVDEISDSLAMRRDLRYGVMLGRAIQLRDIAQLSQWTMAKIDNLNLLIATSGKLVNAALAEAVGAPGEPGSAEDIIYVGRRFGQVYRQILDWTGEFQSVQPYIDCSRVLDIISRASRNVIFEIENFSRTLQQQLSELCQRYEHTGEYQSFEIILRLTLPDMSDLPDELQRLIEQTGGSE